MSTTLNTRIAYEAGTIVIPTNYAGAANDPARVQLLMDIIGADVVDGTNLQDRGFLDEMTPIARLTLYAHLVKLKAAVS